MFLVLELYLHTVCRDIICLRTINLFKVIPWEVDSI